MNSLHTFTDTSILSYTLIYIYTYTYASPNPYTPSLSLSHTLSSLSLSLSLTHTHTHSNTHTSHTHSRALPLSHTCLPTHSEKVSAEDALNARDLAVQKRAAEVGNPYIQIRIESLLSISLKF